MSDRDRLDRIEQKINRIGRFTLFGITLLVISTTVMMVQSYDHLVYGYGNALATAFVVIVLLFFMWARTPFRV